jgi:hypothetical protein
MWYSHKVFRKLWNLIRPCNLTGYLPCTEQVAVKILWNSMPVIDLLWQCHVRHLPLFEACFICATFQELLFSGLPVITLSYILFIFWYYKRRFGPRGVGVGVITQWWNNSLFYANRHHRSWEKNVVEYLLAYWDAVGMPGTECRTVI